MNLNDVDFETLDYEPTVEQPGDTGSEEIIDEK